MAEKIRLDRKIGFQNTFYTKCINVILDSIGLSIILWSIHCTHIILGLQQYSSLTILSHICLMILLCITIHFRQHKNLRNRIYEIRSIKYLNM